MLDLIDSAERILLVVSFIIAFLMVGCDKDSENGIENDSENPCPQPIRVLSMSTPVYGEVPSNSSISIDFYAGGFDFLEISVSGATSTTRLDANTAIWTPVEDMSLGVHTLTIDARRGKCKLEEFTSFVFRVVGPDKTPPKIVDAKCDPENGAMDVNPEDYTDEITIIFSESMLEVDVTSASLDVYSWRLSRGEYIKISTEARENRLPYDTEFRATLSGIGYAGNGLATTEYSFTTMKEPQ